ncbi:hypothetical protein JI742_05260 [Piscinibacter sp. Jin2]|uniref:Uncharacterized protein n=1 Tax=Aquariibacter lacus TaxID=2801332 RepID=A0A9X1BN57_9BURK|nr:hypothetical protein [Piscinibacter lacus]MBL0719295.1 hypothetical protein [Piscinibacter lacus]
MNSENLPIFLEVLLFGGGAIAFGLWQMRSLARDREILRAKRAAEALAAAKEEAAKVKPSSPSQG